LRARRKPQAFAADAVSLWIFNRSLLIINELLLYAAKPTQAILSGPWPQYMAQSSGRGACGFVLADNPPGTFNERITLMCQRQMWESTA
jgi:hypothetical protein